MLSLICQILKLFEIFTGKIVFTFFSIFCRWSFQFSEKTNETRAKQVENFYIIRKIDKSAFIEKLSAKSVRKQYLELNLVKK